MLPLLLMLSFMPVENPDVEMLRNFESAEFDEVPMTPFAMEFSPQGELFIIDLYNSKVFKWDKEGKFIKAFGKKGQGPGEFHAPWAVATTDQHILVWDAFNRVTIFDHDGNFERFFITTVNLPKTIAVLSNDRIITAKREPRENKVFVEFELMDWDGERGDMVKDFHDESVLKPLKGQNDTTVKAFRPDMDIQRDADGNIYIGFSQERKLFQVNEKGEVVGEAEFDFPRQIITPQDKDDFLNMTWRGFRGSRLGWSGMPNLKHDFDHDKAFYTQFVIVGDKVAFIQTPMGGQLGTAHGYSKADYYVADFETGKILYRGKYEYPQDSLVFYRNGKILACIFSSDSDSFDVKEITLKGL